MVKDGLIKNYYGGKTHRTEKVYAKCFTPEPREKAKRTKGKEKEGGKIEKELISRGL